MQVAAEWKEPGIDYHRIWRVQPCKRDGYNKTYVGQFPDGSSVQIDYNFARELVHIDFRPEEDPERLYFSIIKRGVLLQEREFSSNRTVDLNRYLRPLNSYFQYFPDNHVLRSIGGIYNVPAESKVGQNQKRRDLFQWNKFRQRTIQDIWQDFIKSKRIEETKQSLKPWYKRFLHRLPADFIDVLLSVVPISLFFKNQMNPELLALTLASMAFVTGSIDMVFRQRRPLITKAVLFLLPAAALVWLKIQLEQWAIFDPMPDVILTYLKAIV
ncbi:MAG: hypothetical protein H3C43_06445 [Leptonema sp. (in: Bacteria)]|nr:hypothetical protein [Leptonema sp. (in: bacteria)]